MLKVELEELQQGTIIRNAQGTDVLEKMLDKIWLSLKECAEDVKVVKHLNKLQEFTGKERHESIVERERLIQEVEFLKTELEQCWKKIHDLEERSSQELNGNSEVGESWESTEKKELMSKMQSSNTKNHNPSSKHKNRNHVASNPQPHFPWILIIFVSLAALAGLVMYDVTTKGSFKASNTRQILNDSGISSACCTSWKFVNFHAMNVFRWSQTNVPVYYKTAIEFCAPYVNLAKVKSYELGTSFLRLLDALSANISEMTLPILTWLDVNVPPFLKTIRGYFVESVTYVGTILTPIFNGALDVACNIYKWFMENVFIGQLDPQNLQNSAISAMGAVQEYTVSMFRWVSQQVYTS